jgi:hypothetical protein
MIRAGMRKRKDSGNNVSSTRTTLVLLSQERTAIKMVQDVCPPNQFLNRKQKNKCQRGSLLTS